MGIDENDIKEYLRLSGDYLFHRENQTLEFKEQFNLAGLADYFRDFAAFANNRGGHIIFGVKDSPRLPNGLSLNSVSRFEKIDPQKISGYLLDIFSSDIDWDQNLFSFYEKKFGVFKVYESNCKPIIVKKDEGKDLIIKNGDIYFRYSGRTQKIQYAELEAMINNRVEMNNKQWLDLMKKIGKAGPQNAAILDTENSLIEKGESKILVIDNDLADKLKFIKEGQFSEQTGSTTLKLVGDVVPIEKVEVIQKIKENLLKIYPFSALELVEEIRKRNPIISKSDVWNIIKVNDIKGNLEYSAYNFRNKQQEDTYNETGYVRKGIPSIYNYKAVDFIVKLFENMRD